MKSFWVVVVLAILAFFILYNYSEHTNISNTEVENLANVHEGDNKLLKNTAKPHVTPTKTKTEFNAIENKSTRKAEKENNSKSYALPSTEAMEIIAEAMSKRKNLVSKDFSSNKQWSEEFSKDEYSEWGYNLSEEFKDNVSNNKAWVSRAAKLTSVECKTKFCKISFSFSDDVDVNDRNILYPDLFNSSEPNLSFASYYDNETGLQNIFAERCLKCKN